jgi:phage terminase small subunit
MTEKQKRFVDEYILDLNATRAYKVAYPGIKNDNVAWSNASRLLSDAKVSGYVAERLASISAAKLADAQEVMEYLSSVMRGEQTEQVPILCGDGCQRLTSKDLSGKERIKAAELLAKRFGLLTEKLQIEGTLAPTDELKNILTQMGSDPCVK